MTKVVFEIEFEPTSSIEEETVKTNLESVIRRELVENPNVLEVREVKIK